MKYITIILLQIITTAVIAQETSFEYTRRIQTELSLLEKLGPELYISKINNYRTSLEKYFEHKKRVCHGEFSTVVLKGSESSPAENLSKNKLSKEERKLCFREMKALQVTFINNMFLARKRYLVHLHEKRIKELSAAREKAINSLQASFGKSRGLRR
jgi:hypothetical protein